MREPRTDGEATRARILKAAGKLFATTGYAETSSKAIAARANVDVASINYHFGNRAGLYQATLIEAHRFFVNFAHLKDILRKDLSPEEKLLHLIQLFVRRAFQQPRPWHLQLLAREALAPTSHFQILFKEEAEPKQLLIKQLLSDLTGIPVNDPAIIHCLLGVVAPCSILLVGGNLNHGPLHEIAAAPPEATTQYLYTFAIGGLTATAKAWRDKQDCG